jgi:tRNA(adenine34) deaminase
LAIVSFLEYGEQKPFVEIESIDELRAKWSTSMTEIFNRKVERQIEQLQRCAYREMENEISRRRVAWLSRNRPATSTSISPRQAFELLFFDQMGLARDELTVIFETDTEIVWRSFNRCPTLEATQQLGIDTRKICRAINEKATQAFVSQLDPQLRFLRSYEKIRPYTNYCEERIIRVNFEDMMRLAIEEAKRSKQEGEKGYGAALVFGDQILAKAHDTAITNRDPSQHAEMNAIRQAVRVKKDSNLSGVILFSTCEPCPMCSSLAVWANLTTIVYGVSIGETSQLGKSRILVGTQQIVEKSPVMIEVIGGVLREQCRSLYT